jgi:hypothetical protein
MALLTAGQTARAVPLVSSPVARLSSHMVTLLTGERVLVGTSPDGRPMLRIIRSARHGTASQLTTASLNGDEYVIPASAQPYLGRYLDPALFDVTSLAAAGPMDRTALHITFKPGRTPSLPGVTITTSGNGVASGYVTPHSARVFGAALAAQAEADARDGWPASSSLFGSVTGIGPDLAAPPSVDPHFLQVTLIIKAISHTGAPVPFGFGFLMNADNGSRYAAFVLIVNGEARVSVPLGHYMGIFDEVTFTRAGTLDFRVMPVTDYQVSEDRQTLTVDARDAVASPTVTTPRPSSGQELVVSLDGSDAAGNAGFEFGYDLALPSSRIRLAPVAPPSVGTFRQMTRWIRVDPSAPGGRYSFDATFLDDGIPADQARTVPGAASRLATIHERYAADRLLRIGGTARLVLLPGRFFAFASFNPLPMPLSRTDFVYAPAGTLLQDSVLSDFNAWDPGFMNDDLRSADPGSSRSDVWLRNPYTLGVPDPTRDDPFPLCFACRSATGMTFVQFPTDGVATHFGEAFSSPNGSPVAHFAVYRNGILLLKERDSFGDVFEVPKGPGIYRVVADLNRFFTDSLLSTSIKADVTFESSGNSGLPMPPSWYCFTARNCRVLPVLRALVDLHASPQGTLPIGRSIFDVAVGHIEGAADTAITKVTVAVRRAGGTVWRPLPVTSPAAGHYQAAFTASPVLDGRAMDIRVTATDADGGVLRQTTTRAFLVSS